MKKKAQKVTTKKATTKKAPTKKVTPVKKDTQKVSLKKAVKNEPKPKKKKEVRTEAEAAAMLFGPNSLVTLPLREVVSMIISATLAGRDESRTFTVQGTLASEGVEKIKELLTRKPAQVEPQPEAPAPGQEVQTRNEEISPDDF